MRSRGPEGERNPPYDSGRPGRKDAQQKDGEDDEAERFPLDQLLLEGLLLVLHLWHSSDRDPAVVLVVLLKEAKQLGSA